MTDSNNWPRLVAAVDGSRWGGMRQRIREWVTDVTTSSEFFDTRVPFPPRHSPALYLSSGLLISTLRNCGGRVPIGTTTLAAAHCIIFLKPDGVSLNSVSLLPYRVLQKKELRRLLIAAFVHLDVTHVLFNLNSLVETGLMLEPQMGAVPFLLDVTMITFLSHGIYVSAAWLEKILANRTLTYYSIDTVGFSSVAFALSVLSGAMNSSNPNMQSSVPIPMAYHVWLHLVITTLCFQNSNHLGHISGILAGLVRLFVPGPFLWIRRSVTQMLQFLTGVKLKNRCDDEAKLKRQRGGKQLLHHFGLFAASLVVYLFKTRNAALR